MKTKPPNGSKNLPESAGKNNNNQKEIETEVIKSCEVISNNTNEDSSDFEAEPNSIQDEIILTTPTFDEKSAAEQQHEDPGSFSNVAQYVDEMIIGANQHTSIKSEDIIFFYMC